MMRRLCALVAGLTVAGAGLAGGLAAPAWAGAVDGSGPVAAPPSSPQTVSVSGVAVNGVQLSMTVPAQLPVDLPGQQLPQREVDVTVKDAGGQGFTGTVNTTLTPEGAAAPHQSLRVDHYNLATGQWETQSVAAGVSTFTVADAVTVPANGTQVLKLRLAPGTTAVDDVKVSSEANGASAVATVPVTEPAFQASGLTASVRPGTASVLTGKLTNPTDVDFQQVPVKLVLCASGSTACVHAADVKVEAQVGGGAWQSVAVADDAAAPGALSGTVVPGMALPHGGSVHFAVRVTVGTGAFGVGATPSSALSPAPSQVPAQPMTVPLAIGPVGLTLAGQPVASGTLTVQAPPQPTPTTPSSTPSSGASTSVTPSPTDSATDTPTAAPTTDTLTTDPSRSAVAAATPSATGSSNSPTILVAAGLLAVCLALVLWWTLMKRRERVAAAAAAASAESGDAEDEG